jgi:hypothetical protein
MYISTITQYTLLITFLFKSAVQRNGVPIGKLVCIAVSFPLELQIVVLQE